MRFLRTCACVASLLCISPAAALAQDGAAPSGASDKSDKEVARALAERGFELLEQGEAEKAIVSFRMAERRIHSPAHLLFIARAEVKLGKFVEAIATYEALAAEKIPAGSPRPFQEAQNDGKAELEALRARTPSIKIIVLGVPASEAQVTIDGVPVKPELLGTAQRINPGKHIIVATAPDASAAEKTLTLAEGTYVQTLELSLQPSGVSAGAIVAFSLGGVGLVVGTATGVAYLGKTNASSTLGVVSLAGFVTGGVGIVTGTLLVALSGSDQASASASASRSTSRPTSRSASRPASSPEPRVRVGVGLGSLVVSGVF
jgi:hypothetical protein